MTYLQALAFFLREALVSLRRSWKVSALAVVTIAVSLFIGGVFLLLTGNLTRIVRQWRSEARVVVYLDEDASAAERAELVDVLERSDWVSEVVEVSAGEARARFTAAFPGLAALLGEWEGGSFPASLEVAYDPDLIDSRALSRWQSQLTERPGVALVDDDRQWLRQVERLIAFMRAIGLLLGGVLLVAAIFTIASVIRLAAYVYRDEIAVLRLVGATEFMIRGPFFVEGLIQGFLGGVLAVVGLFLAYRLMGAQSLPSIFGAVLLDRFLEVRHLVVIVGVGSLAGLLGSVMSLRREAGSVFD